MTTAKKGIPVFGDRSVWDVINYPAFHASDLDAGTPIYHVPTGLVVGDILVWDGTKWQRVPRDTGWTASSLVSVKTLDAEDTDEITIARTLASLITALKTMGILGG